MIDLKFKIFVEEQQWFELPFAALMRTNPEKGCDILVSNLGTNSQASNFVLGSAFLQQFMVQYTPATATHLPKAKF